MKKHTKADVYAGFSLQQLTTEINDRHSMAHTAAHACLEHVRRCGLALIEAKRKVPHGMWQKWLRENTTISERSARAYKRVATHWPRIQASKRQGTAVLTLSQALKYIAEPERPKAECNDFKVSADHVVNYPPLDTVSKPIKGPFPARGCRFLGVHLPTGGGVIIDPWTDERYWYITAFAGDGQSDVIFPERAINRDYVHKAVALSLHELLGDAWIEAPTMHYYESEGVPDDGYHYLTTNEKLSWATDPDKIRRSHPTPS